LILADAASFYCHRIAEVPLWRLSGCVWFDWNTSREPNIFSSFPFYNVDLSVTKAFKIRERLSMQFRAEFFNVFNHSNIANTFGGLGGDNTYTDPSGDIGAIFGVRPQTPDVTSSNPVLGSGDPRAIQLGLKLIF
jgi:hypothetical protein